MHIFRVPSYLFLAAAAASSSALPLPPAPLPPQSIRPFVGRSHSARAPCICPAYLPDCCCFLPRVLLLLAGCCAHPSVPPSIRPAAPASDYSCMYSLQPSFSMLPVISTARLFPPIMGGKSTHSLVRPECCLANPDPVNPDSFSRFSRTPESDNKEVSVHCKGYSLRL